MTDKGKNIDDWKIEGADATNPAPTQFLLEEFTREVALVELHLPHCKRTIEVMQGMKSDLFKHLLWMSADMIEKEEAKKGGRK